MRRRPLANSVSSTILASAAILAGLSGPPRTALAQSYVQSDPQEHPRVAYGDNVSLNDRCPVRQAKLNLTYVPVYINRKPISFCCMSCPGVFVQSPEQYLRALQIQPPSVFVNGKKTIVDSSLRYQIGFEIYYFGNRAEMARFKRSPLRYCGELTDPVTMARFRPTASSPRVEYSGRVYYFAADSSRAQFLASPEKHKDRRNGTS